MLDPTFVKIMFAILSIFCVLAITVSIWATYDNVTDYRIAKRRNRDLIPVARVRILREAVPLIAIPILLALSIMILFEVRRWLLITALFMSMFSHPIVILVYGAYDRYIRHKKMFQLRSRFMTAIEEDKS